MVYYHDNECWWVHSLPLCRFLISNGFEFLKITQDVNDINKKAWMFRNSAELQEAIKVYQRDKRKATDKYTIYHKENA